MNDTSTTAATVYASLDALVRLQYQAKGFSFLPRQPVNGLMSGRHSSRLRGRGLTFEELRGYRPGDDIRTMDWRATARLRKPHVRVYSEERERPVLLVVDQRSNMFFGSERTTKATAAAELAALAAWRVLAAGDRVGALIIGNQEIVEIRPHRSRENVLRICHEIVRVNNELKPANQSSAPEKLNEAFGRAVNVAKHNHLVVLATDYYGDNAETQRLAARLATHNDVVAALVYDPLGIQLPGNGEFPATDGTTQQTIAADARFSERFRKAFLARADEIRGRLKRLRIPILPISTCEPVVDQVVAALGRRR